MRGSAQMWSTIILIHFRSWPFEPNLNQQYKEAEDKRGRRPPRKAIFHMTTPKWNFGSNSSGCNAYFSRVDSLLRGSWLSFQFSRWTRLFRGSVQPYWTPVIFPVSPAFHFIRDHELLQFRRACICIYQDTSYTDSLFWMSRSSMESWALFSNNHNQGRPFYFSGYENLPI